MANPERRSILNRVTGGRLGRRGQPAEVAQVSPAQPPLSPEARAARNNLAAILNAYDLSSPEEQTRMRAEMETTGDTTVGGEAYRRGRAAAQMSDLLGESRKEGIRRLETLEEVSEQIPGIANVVGLLAEEPPEAPKKEQE